MVTTSAAWEQELLWTVQYEREDPVPTAIRYMDPDQHQRTIDRSMHMMWPYQLVCIRSFHISFISEPKTGFISFESARKTLYIVTTHIPHSWQPCKSLSLPPCYCSAMSALLSKLFCATKSAAEADHLCYRHSMNLFQREVPDYDLDITLPKSSDL